METPRSSVNSFEKVPTFNILPCVNMPHTLSFCYYYCLELKLLNHIMKCIVRCRHNEV